MIRRKRNRITGRVLLFIMGCCLLAACNSQKRGLEEKIEKLQSKAIEMPYERMACWASDSIKAISPWNKAKLKLVHYIDTLTCSTCYLQKAALNELICSMEKLSNNEFYNVFIINPDSKTKKRLESDFHSRRIPQTIFVDSTNIFMETNSNIPSESMYHTFLLDENNKVVLVGNPIANEKIGDLLQTLVEKKLGKKFNIYK